ncbi:MAG: TIM barrel protein [Ilumatobacteraceae bacterium]
MPRDVVLAHFSVRDASFPDRCAAANTAGFDGIGLYIGEYSRLRAEGHSDDDLLAVLAEHDMRVAEVEALPIFADDQIEPFLHLCATFRPDRIQVIPPFRGEVDRVAAGDWLAAVADRVGRFGTTLAIEFLPFTDIADAAAAVELVERAGRPNVGLCVDSWHVFRGAGLLSLVGLDPAMVASVQFNDGPLEPVLADYVQDCLHHRETPGEGEFDLRGFLELLPADVPISIEVPDDDLDALTPLEAAGVLMGETQRYL